jgi:hypothetical protein
MRFIHIHGDINHSKTGSRDGFWVKPGMTKCTKLISSGIESEMKTILMEEADEIQT